MKVYIASRVRDANTVVKTLREKLSGLGYEISFDWALGRKIPEPYTEYKDEAMKLAENAKQGALDADIFILIWDENLYGALIELGIFLAGSTKKKPKPVYILGKKDRVCVFEMLPEFKCVETIPGLLELMKSHR